MQALINTPEWRIAIKCLSDAKSNFQVSISHYVFQESHVSLKQFAWITDFINVNCSHNTGTPSHSHAWTCTTYSGALIRQGQAVTGETYGVLNGIHCLPYGPYQSWCWRALPQGYTSCRNQNGWPPFRATFHVPSNRCIIHHLIPELFVCWTWTRTVKRMAF